MVGRTFLKVLEETKLPVENYYLFASKRSAGTKVTFMGKEYTVEELTETSFDRGIDIALFSAGGSTSEKFAPIAAAKGCVVIDNSSAWRMNPEVPLVVPEVNPDDIKWNKGIIANPNCSTIQAMVALKPLHDKYKIKRVVLFNLSGSVRRRNVRLQGFGGRLKGRSSQKVPAPDCRQLSSAYRRISPQRLYQRGDENGQRNEENPRRRQHQNYRNDGQSAGFLRSQRVHKR